MPVSRAGAGFRLQDANWGATLPVAGVAGAGVAGVAGVGGAAGAIGLASRAPGGSAEIIVAGVALVADIAGALFWPEERLLAVSDLHLEKGSAFAARGVLLPPFDTASTLERLGRLTQRYAAQIVVALGDNFHDIGGPARLAASDRKSLLDMQRGRDWIWIAGNHDPEPLGIGGAFARSLAVGALVFRHEPKPHEPKPHEPKPQANDGEIAGHLHPSARIHRRGRTLVRRCFASDGKRLVMPAFGAYAGGLNIRHAEFLKVFGVLAFTAHLIGERRLYSFAAARCLAD
jgi:DNA ligase-associated metallophosphoesterase